MCLSLACRLIQKTWPLQLRLSPTGASENDVRNPPIEVEASLARRALT
jgi:hypothetical protein